MCVRPSCRSLVVLMFQHTTLQAMSSLSVEWRELPAATASTVFSIPCMNLFVGLS